MLVVRGKKKMGSRRRESGGANDVSQPFSASHCECAPKNGISARSFDAKYVLNPF